MKTITWSIGSDSKLDNLFNNLREHQYQDKSHRLWQNYSKESFEYAGIIACTINFNDQQEPEMCSTISSRPCWPKNVYRILNRAWKHTNRTKTRIEISQGMGDSVISQIEWLKENTDYKMYFISRFRKFLFQIPQFFILDLQRQTSRFLVDRELKEAGYELENAYDDVSPYFDLLIFKKR